MKDQRLEEEVDYYFDENGLFVFTKEYLKRRGYCCKNGCKNCPYPKDSEAEKE